MAKTPTQENAPYDFEVEIESGGRAYDDGMPAPQTPVVLSPTRAAAKARADGAISLLLRWGWLVCGVRGVVLVHQPDGEYTGRCGGAGEWRVHLPG